MKLSYTDLRVAVRFFYVFEPNHHPTNPLLLTCENVKTYFRLYVLGFWFCINLLNRRGRNRTS